VAPALDSLARTARLGIAARKTDGVVQARITAVTDVSLALAHVALLRSRPRPRMVSVAIRVETASVPITATAAGEHGISS
jgi:hypothetical protein